MKQGPEHGFDEAQNNLPVRYWYCSKYSKPRVPFIRVGAARTSRDPSNRQETAGWHRGGIIFQGTKCKYIQYRGWTKQTYTGSKPAYFGDTYLIESYELAVTGRSFEIYSPGS